MERKKWKAVLHMMVSKPNILIATHADDVLVFSLASFFYARLLLLLLSRKQSRKGQHLAPSFTIIINIISLAWLRTAESAAARTTAVLDESRIRGHLQV